MSQTIEHWCGCSLQVLESKGASWLEKLGQLNFERRRNAGKDIPHADCLSQVRTGKSGTTTFVAILTKSDTGIEYDITNPWQLVQDTDRKSNEMKQNHNKNKFKVEQTKTRQATNVEGSRELWKFWVDLRTIEKIDALFYRKRKTEKLYKCCNKL